MTGAFRRMPGSVGEYLVILFGMVGFITCIALVASALLWGVKTILGTDYMTVLTHLIVGWIGATIGILLGERTEDTE